MSPALSLDRPDGRIAYDVAGTGPLVICVPGMGELRQSFCFTVPALVSAGFTVVTMDIRGHGDSDTTFGTYDNEAGASDVVALVEAIDAGPAVIVGNSMGAAIAVIASAHRPELVAGLALLGPFVRNPPANPVVTALMRGLMAGPWATAAWLSYWSTLFPGSKPADFAEYRAALRASLRRPGHGKAFRRTTHTSHAPAEARLGDVAAPVLVVMGSADPDFKDATAEARWIAATLNGEAVVIEGVGHYPQAEAPDATHAALVPFARKAHGRG